MELGVAFQIVDDVLDLYGHGHALGKPAGSDLREGIFTLPVLMTLQRDPALVELLVEGIDEQGVDEVARRVRAAGADRRAIALALDHLQVAFAHLGDPGVRAGGRTAADRDRRARARAARPAPARQRPARLAAPGDPRDRQGRRGMSALTATTKH